jgi:hypothetical protein
MELKRELLSAEMVDPGTGELVTTPVEVRFDPLTHHSARILSDRRLMPANDLGLEAFARERAFVSPQRLLSRGKCVGHQWEDVRSPCSHSREFRAR